MSISVQCVYTMACHKEYFALMMVVCSVIDLGQAQDIACNGVFSRSTGSVGSQSLAFTVPSPQYITFDACGNSTSLSIDGITISPINYGIAPWVSEVHRPRSVSAGGLVRKVFLGTPNAASIESGLTNRLPLVNGTVINTGGQHEPSIGAATILYIGYFRAPASDRFQFRIAGTVGQYGGCVVWVGNSAVNPNASNSFLNTLSATQRVAFVSLSAGQYIAIRICCSKEALGDSGPDYFIDPGFRWKRLSDTDYSFDLSQNFYRFEPGTDFYRGRGLPNDRFCNNQGGELLRTSLAAGSYTLDVSDNGQSYVSMRCGEYWRKSTLFCGANISDDTSTGADTLAGEAKEHHYRFTVSPGDAGQGWFTFDTCGTGVGAGTRLAVYSSDMRRLIVESSDGSGCESSNGAKLLHQFTQPGQYWLVVEGSAPGGKTNVPYNLRTTCGPTWERGFILCNQNRTTAVYDGGATLLSTNNQTEHHYTFVVTQATGLVLSLQNSVANNVCVKIYQQTSEIQCNSRTNPNASCALPLQSLFGCTTRMQARLLPGTYTIVAHTSARSVSNSSYTLSVSCNNFWMRGALTCGTRVTGSIDPNFDSANTIGTPASEHHYSFQVSATGKYEFNACEPGGSGMTRVQLQIMQASTPYVALYTNNAVCGGGIRGTTLSNVTLSPGQYIVAIESLGPNPLARGSYGLTTRCANQGTIQCGQRIIGNTNSGIDAITSNGRREHHYTFSVLSASWVTFDGCTGQSGSSNAIIAIYDNSLQSQVQGLRDTIFRGCPQGSRGSKLTSYLEPGAYTLFIEGDTGAANYNISMLCTQFWNRGSINCGQTIAGDTSRGTDFIGNFAQEEQYTFSVLAGQTGFRTFSVCDSGGSQAQSKRITIYAGQPNISTQPVLMRANGGCFNEVGTSVTYEFVPGQYTIVIEGQSSVESGPYNISARCDSSWEKGAVSDGSILQDSTDDGTSVDVFTRSGREHHYSLTVPRIFQGFSISSFGTIGTTCVWLYTAAGVKLDDNNCTNFSSSCVQVIGNSACPSALSARLVGGNYVVVVQGNSNSGTGGTYQYQINADPFWIKNSLTCGSFVLESTQANSIGVVGNPAPEHHYPMLITTARWVSIDSCNSQMDGTTLHIIQQDGTPVASAQPATCLGSGRNAAILNTWLENGQYFVVVEGPGTNTGLYRLTVRCALNMTDPSIACNDVKVGDSSEGVNALLPVTRQVSGRERHFIFTVQSRSWVSFDGCTGSGTLFIANRDVSTIVQQYRDPTGRGCSAASQGGRVHANLAPGSYVLVIRNALGTSAFNVSMTCGSFWEQPALQCQTPVVPVTVDTTTGADIVGDFSREVAYPFSTSANTENQWRTFDACGTGINGGPTNFFVYQRGIITPNTSSISRRETGGCGGETGTRLVGQFPQGDYTLIAEGNGLINGQLVMRQLCGRNWREGTVNACGGRAQGSTADGNSVDVFKGAGLEKHWTLPINGIQGVRIRSRLNDPTCLWLTDTQGQDVGCDGSGAGSCVVSVGPAGCASELRGRLYPGVYTLVVQGRNGGSGGSYDVNVSCGDFWIQDPLSCGMNFTGSTTTGISTYGSNLPEHHHPFNVSNPGWYSFDTCGTVRSQDVRLQLHRTNFVGPVVNIALPNTGCGAGVLGTRLGPVWLRNGLYTLVVETASTGTYSLAVSCAPAGELQCGGTMQGSAEAGIDIIEGPLRERFYSFSLSTTTWVTFDGCDSTANRDTRIYVGGSNVTSSSDIVVSRSSATYKLNSPLDISPGVAYVAFPGDFNQLLLGTLGSLPFAAPSYATELNFNFRYPNPIQINQRFGALFHAYFRPPTTGNYRFRFRECAVLCAFWLGDHVWSNTTSLDNANLRVGTSRAPETPFGTQQIDGLDASSIYPVRLEWSVNLDQIGRNVFFVFEWKRADQPDSAYTTNLTSAFFYFGSGVDYEQYSSRGLSNQSLVGTGCGVGPGAQLTTQLSAGDYTVAVESPQSYSIDVSCGSNSWMLGNISCGDVRRADVNTGVDRIGHTGREHHYDLVVGFASEYAVVVDAGEDVCIRVLNQSGAVPCDNCTTQAGDASCVTAMRVSLVSGIYTVIVEGDRDIRKNGTYSLFVSCASIQYLGSNTACGENISIAGPNSVPSSSLARFSPVYELDVSIRNATWYTINGCNSTTAITSIGLYNTTNGVRAGVISEATAGCGNGPGALLSVLLPSGSFKLIIGTELRAQSSAEVSIRCGTYWIEQPLVCAQSFQGNTANGALVYNSANRELHYPFSLLNRTGFSVRQESITSQPKACLSLRDSNGDMVPCNATTVNCVPTLHPVVTNCVIAVDSYLPSGNYSAVWTEDGSGGEFSFQALCSAFWHRGTLQCGTPLAALGRLGVSTLTETLIESDRQRYYSTPVREVHFGVTVPRGGKYELETCSPFADTADNVLILDGLRTQVIAASQGTGCPSGMYGASVSFELSRAGDYSVVAFGGTGLFNATLFCGAGGSLSCNSNASGSTRTGIDLLVALQENETCSTSNECDVGLFCRAGTVNGVINFYCLSCTRCNGGLDATSIPCSPRCSAFSNIQPAREIHFSLTVPADEVYVFDGCANQPDSTDANLKIFRDGDLSSSGFVAASTVGDGCGNFGGSKLVQFLQQGSYVLVAESNSSDWTFNIETSCGTSWNMGELACNTQVSGNTQGSHVVLDPSNNNGHERHYALNVTSTSGFEFSLNPGSGQTCLLLFDDQGNSIPNCADRNSENRCYISSDTVCLRSGKARLTTGQYTAVVSSAYAYSGAYTLDLNCIRFWERPFVLGQEIFGDTDGFNVLTNNPNRERHYVVEVPQGGARYNFWVCGVQNEMDFTGNPNSLNMFMYSASDERGNNNLFPTDLGFCSGGVTMNLDMGGRYIVVIEPAEISPGTVQNYRFSMGGSDPNRSCTLGNNECIVSTLGICFYCTNSSGAELFLGAVSRSSTQLELDLSNSGIEQIGAGAFDVVSNLRRLNMSGNQLTSLVRENLDRLRMLQVLDVSHNSIIRLEGQAIASPSLTLVVLSDNPLDCSFAASVGTISCLSTACSPGQFLELGFGLTKTYICDYSSTVGVTSSLQSTPVVVTEVSTHSGDVDTTPNVIFSSTTLPNNISSDGIDGNEGDGDGGSVVIAVVLGVIIFLVIVGTGIWYVRRSRKEERINRSDDLVARQLEFSSNQSPMSQNEFWGLGQNQVDNPVFVGGIPDGGLVPSTVDSVVEADETAGSVGQRSRVWDNADGEDPPIENDTSDSVPEKPVWMTTLSRQDATAQLSGLPDGSFVVRPSSSASSGYCVTCVVNGVIKNYTIWKDPFGFSFPKIDTKYDRIEDLIEAAMAGPVKGFPVQLLRPPAAKTDSNEPSLQYDTTEVLKNIDEPRPEESYTQVNKLKISTQKPLESSVDPEAHLDGFEDENPAEEDKSVEELANEATQFLLTLNSPESEQAGQDGYLDVESKQGNNDLEC